MATDLAASVNGMYGGQYGQPAELAASIPSSTQASATSQADTESAADTTIADPQQIGWYFVKQYYTTLSEHPDRIHLFYSKKSQLVTGVEAEKVLPAVGGKAIKEKIKELDIQNCKVRVLNVDSQTSLNNIVVQVIGMMSNKSAPSKKFVQMFVLTPQTNGYYVLNDIFRYLNDEEDEIIEDEPSQEPAQEPAEEPAEEPVPVVEASALPPPTSGMEQDTANNEAAVEQVDAKLEEVANTDAEPTVNGASMEPAEDPVAREPSPEVPEEVVAPVPAENPSEPEHTPAGSPPKALTPAPAAEAPPSKKTWANLVASKAVASPAVPISTPTVPAHPKPQKSPQPTPQSQVSSSTTEQDDSPASQGNEWQTADHSKKQSRPQNKGAPEGNVLGYIKNVTEKIEASRLRSALEKYGEVKYFDVSRPKNCAFVEFATPTGYNAAVAANPHQIGSEQIYVEERRPRPNAFGGSNSGFNRGGANAGRGRGASGPPGRSGSQNGGFPKEAGRGNFQQRGGKSGNITPKGRGQAQPV